MSKTIFPIENVTFFAAVEDTQESRQSSDQQPQRVPDSVLLRERHLRDPHRTHMSLTRP